MNKRLIFADFQDFCWVCENMSTRKNWNKAICKNKIMQIFFNAEKTVPKSYCAINLWLIVQSIYCPLILPLRKTTPSKLIYIIEILKGEFEKHLFWLPVHTKWVNCQNFNSKCFSLSHNYGLKKYVYMKTRQSMVTKKKPWRANLDPLPFINIMKTKNFFVIHTKFTIQFMKFMTSIGGGLRIIRASNNRSKKIMLNKQ